MYEYIYIYTYIYTWTRALTRLETGRQVALKECAEKVRWLGTELELERSATVTVSNDFVWRLPGAHHPAFWVPTVHLRFLVWRFKRLALGPGRVFPRSQGKKDHDFWSHMVPEVMRNGPGYTSTKELWSHEWWEMVLTSIWMKIPIHRFIDPRPVNRSRSISTVDKDSPTGKYAGEYGRYRRSIRTTHLQRITVDRRWWIKIRNNFVVCMYCLARQHTRVLRAQRVLFVEEPTAQPLPFGVLITLWVTLHCSHNARSLQPTPAQEACSRRQQALAKHQKNTLVKW